MTPPHDLRSALSVIRATHERTPVRALWLIGVPLVAVTVLDPHLSLFGSPLIWSLNALPLIVCSLLLLALTRRVALSVAASVIVFALAFAVNRVKMRELQDVIVPHDLRLISQVLTNADFFVRYGSVETGVLLLLLGSASLLILMGLVRYEPVVRGLVPGRQLGLGALAVLVGAAMIYPTTPLGRLYSSDVLPSDPRPTASARQIGLIATFIKVTGSMQQGLPDYDPNVARAFYESIAPAESTVTLVGQRPDLIVVMAESFFDPSILNGIDRVSQLDAVYRMRSGAVSGNLAVASGAGGGTMRTEFEFLTGVSLLRLPTHPYPYYSLVRAGFPSLPRLLKAAGYDAIAMHPHRSTFWNRNIAYPALGFDHFYAEDSFPRHRDGFFISDSVLVDHIISVLDDDAPQFIFAVSIEGHGPWTRRPVADPVRRDTIWVPEILDDQDALSLRNVLYHLENTSEALSRLHTFIQSRKVPTALLFFGDHLPYPESVYEVLGFRNGGTDTEQTVPFMITANYPISPEHVDTCSYFLGSLFLDVAGVMVGREFAWNAYLRTATEGFSSQSGRLHCVLSNELAADQHHLQTAWLARYRLGSPTLRSELDWR